MQVRPLTRSEAMACQFIVFVPVNGRIVAATNEPQTLLTACAEITSGSWDIPAPVAHTLLVLDRSNGRTLPILDVTELALA